MRIRDLDINVRLSMEQREFLRDFFKTEIVNELFIKHDMLEPDDIKLFINLYSEYLEDSKYNDLDVFKCFIFELKEKLYV